MWLSFTSRKWITMMILSMSHAWNRDVILHQGARSQRGRMNRRRYQNEKAIAMLISWQISTASVSVELLALAIFVAVNENLISILSSSLMLKKGMMVSMWAVSIGGIFKTIVGLCSVKPMQQIVLRFGSTRALVNINVLLLTIISVRVLIHSWNDIVNDGFDMVLINIIFIADTVDLYWRCTSKFGSRWRRQLCPERGGRAQRRIIGGRWHHNRLQCPVAAQSWIFEIGTFATELDQTTTRFRETTTTSKESDSEETRGARHGPAYSIWRLNTNDNGSSSATMRDKVGMMLMKFVAGLSKRWFAFDEWIGGAGSPSPFRCDSKPAANWQRICLFRATSWYHWFWSDLTSRKAHHWWPLI